MRIKLLVVLLVFSILVTLLVGCASDPVEFTGDLIIDNVTLIDVRDGNRIPSQTVVLEGTRISAILPSNTDQLLVAEQVVDGTGTFLIPGLWDMHVHAVWPSQLEPFYLQMLAHGVTGFRDTWGIRGIDAAVADAIAAGELLGPPRRVIAGNLVDGPNPVWPGSLVAADAGQARALVDELHASGSPFVKVYSKLSREAYFAIAERATELSMPFAGHVPLSITAREAAEAGQRSVEHLTEIANGCTAVEAELKQSWRQYYASDRRSGERGIVEQTRNAHDEETCRSLFKLLKEREVWQVPTLITVRGYAFMEELAEAGDERLRYLPASTVAGWRPPPDAGKPPEEIEAAHARFAHNLELVGLMADVGVPILAGSDTPNPWAFPGSGLHDELALLVKAGLTSLEALRAATLQPAIFFGREAELGTIESGKIADLVLLDADPLEDIENVRKIRAVIADGRLHHREIFDEALEALAARLARPSIATWIREAMEEGGIEAARARFAEARQLGETEVNLDESELNRLGYGYLEQGRPEDAVAIFELNRDAYPESANMHDSLGDGLKAVGRIEEARAMYQRAVELAEASGDPDGLLEAFRTHLASVSQ